MNKQIEVVNLVLKGQNSTSDIWRQKDFPHRTIIMHFTQFFDTNITSKMIHDQSNFSIDRYSKS